MCFARAASGRSLDDSRSRSLTDGDGKREGEKKRGWQEEWRMEEERQCRQAKHKGMRQRHCFPLPRQTIVCTLHLPLPNRSRLGVSVRPTRPDPTRADQHRTFTITSALNGDHFRLWFLFSLLIVKARPRPPAPIAFAGARTSRPP